MSEPDTEVSGPLITDIRKVLDGLELYLRRNPKSKCRGHLTRLHTELSIADDLLCRENGR